MVEAKSSWGGYWTEQKLNAFIKYVNAYLTIMNEQRGKYRWQILYFDGFAGSGSNNYPNQKKNEDENPLLDQLDPIDKDFIYQFQPYKSAAERVLSIKQNGFDAYYFIDNDRNACDALQERLSKFTNNKNMHFICADANTTLKRFAGYLHKNIKNTKALVFLDPFGMQIQWESIKAFQGTGCDLWILVPTGVIVNRLLNKDGELPHLKKLETFFGIDEKEIRKLFYEEKEQRTLFGESIQLIEKVNKPIEKIACLYLERLKTIFQYTVRKPLTLKNIRNVPIYHFVFASNNQTAVKIANDIIGKSKK